MDKIYFDIVVIGGGIAGVSAIKKIRELNSELTILLITNEDRLPYKRTKVNKHIAVEFTKDQFKLFIDEWYQANGITIRYEQVEQLNTKEKTIKFNSSEIISFGKLLIATGTQPFIPEIIGADSEDLMVVHYAASVEKLKSRLANMSRLLIVGGGVEGIETAYELIKLHKEVIIVDSNKNTLSRLFPPHISDRIYSLLKQNGVRYFNETKIRQVEKRETYYKLYINDEKIEVDGIIVCAGTRPNIDIAKQVELKTNIGIKVNKCMQTSHPDIFAAGDVAEHEGGIVTGLWHPAEYQGLNAGINMVNIGFDYQPVPMRLKTSVFGEFFFTANFANKNIEGTETVRFNKDRIWGEIYLNNDTIIGITMMNDKERAKKYNELITTKASLDKFRIKFPEFTLTQYSSGLD